MIGSLAEAQEIYEYAADRWADDWSEFKVPPGWKYIGSGGTRCVYLSPSGVVYKVEYDQEDEDWSPNEIEHRNFEVIRTKKKLPRKWRVPKSHLHSFKATVAKYDYRSHDVVRREEEVSVIACDYVDGEEVGYRAPWQRARAMDRAFACAGLHDNARYNAMWGNDGYRYIIDAGEAPLPEAA